MKTLLQILKSLALLSVAGFCGFGFLASFEPGNSLLWKAGYGLLGGENHRIAPNSQCCLVNGVLNFEIILFFTDKSREAGVTDFEPFDGRRDACPATIRPNLIARFWPYSANESASLSRIGFEPFSVVSVVFNSIWNP